MRPFPWLPVGHLLQGGQKVGFVISEGSGHQVIRSGDGSRCALLIDKKGLSASAIERIQTEGALDVGFAGRELFVALFSLGDEPFRVGDLPDRAKPVSSTEAASLSGALAALGQDFPEADWEDAVFVPAWEWCLPSRESTSCDRRLLAVRIVTRGVADVSLSLAEIRALNPWLSEEEVGAFFARLGVSHPDAGEREPQRPSKLREDVKFRLAGRPELEAFFNEYVVEHHRRWDQYASMGVLPPNGVLLEGPPGTGKTFAVKALAEFLGWPVLEVDMGTIGSPYVHQSSMKLRKVFLEAAAKAPSIVVVNEVDALSGVRAAGSHDHKLEEVSEFLKLIETAAEKRVLVIGTTNRKAHIDPAFLRKGRFDHVFTVGFPEREEVQSVLETLLERRPVSAALPIAEVAATLAGRPMSDVAWVINEAARMAVAAQKEVLDAGCLEGAVERLVKRASPRSVATTVH